MSVAGLFERGWQRRALVGVLVLVALSPVFAWASGAVGYAEPLENAAERTGAVEHERTVVPGLFPDYSIPGFPAPLGTLVSGVVGSALALLLALAAGRVLQR